jgi:hypothetical protein
MTTTSRAVCLNRISIKSAIIFALMVVSIAFGWTAMKGISPNCPPYFDPERTGIVWQCIPHYKR